ncbi:thiolase-like protein, partial [Massarina eburnea CBS 473.64]
ISSGATKANIGHTEAGSGIAGIIKTNTALEKGAMPPIAHLQRVNPRIRAPNLRVAYFNLKFPTETTLWPDTGLRRASVQSFGFGGKNAHAVLDDAANFLSSRGIPSHRRTRTDSHLSTPILQPVTTQTSTSKLLLWSAPNKSALARTMASYATYFEESVSNGNISDEALTALAQILDERRTKLPFRTFTVSESIPHLVNVVSDAAAPTLCVPTRKLALVFTGQGAQW